VLGKGSNLLLKVHAIGFLTIAFAGMGLTADRTVKGTVYYKGGEPAAEAAVQLEDRTTQQIISHIADREGHFEFIGLNPDKDYQIKATKKGRWSKAHGISRFSSRTLEIVNLYLRPE
jgi:hypothetical protein